MTRRVSMLFATAALLGVLGAGGARAQSWLDQIRVSGDIDVGATMNPQNPDTGVNFGRLFTDRANQIVLDRFALAAERAPDPTSGTIDLGFRVEGMYGADSRFTHFQGLGDHPTTSRNSFDLVEGDLQAHAPWLTPRGVDLKLGFFPTPMGEEAIDPARNFFYSHSYIFDFGLPRKHTGLLTTTHVSPVLDLYLGYTTGVNASLGSGGGYNDGQPHLLAGVGLDLGRVTIKAFTHIGPEDPPALLPPGVDPHRQRRYINDAVIDWRVTDKLNSVTELNYVRDDGLRAQAGGAAEYLTYPLSRVVSAGVRAEVWRDAQGAFVAGYPAPLDYIDAEEGLPNGAFRAGPATYGAVTVGLNVRPSGLPAMIDGLTVRPEVRYDRVLAGTSAFGGRPGSSRDQVTVGADVVVPLSFPREEGTGRGGDFITSTRAPAPDAPDGAPGAGASSPLSPELDAGGPAQEGRAGSPRSGVVTVVGAAELDQLQPRTLEDLDGFAPDLVIARTGTAPEGAAITLRGLGDAEPIAGARMPGVSVIVDGVVMATGAGQLIDLFGADTVTVERGASGWTGGPDAIGGAVSVERAAPTRRWGAEASYGLEQGYHANIEQALLNAPVGEDAGLSLAVSHRQRGGYLNNIYTGDGLYGRDELTTGTAQFDWTVTPRLNARAEVTLTHEDGEGAPMSLGDPLAARLLGPSLAAAIPGVRFNAYGSPYVPGVTQPLGAYTTANDYPDRNLLTSQVYSLRLTYESPIGRFASTTAFMKQNDDTQQDLDGGCAVSDLGGRPCGVLANPVVGFLHLSLPAKYDQFTQDLRFTRDLWDRVHLAAGVYYFHSDASAVELVRRPAPIVLGNAPASVGVTSERLEETAGFAALTVDVTSRLRVSGAVRYVDDSTFGQTSRKALTRFAVDYQLSEGALIYADRAVGMRPGGEAPFNAFGPETAVTYEVGSKNTFLAGRLKVNAAGFWTEDSGRQADETVLAPGSGPLIETFVVNIPRVEIKGAELEVAWRPALIDGLTLSGEGGYQDARITRGLVPGPEYPVNPDATPGAAGTTVNLAGAPLERVPRFNGMIRADYARPLAQGVLDVNAGYRWTDRYALAQVTGQGDWQGAYGLVDLSVSYSRDFYRLSVTARNLTNQLYFSNATPALFVHGWGEPRTVVVALAVGF